MKIHLLLSLASALLLQPAINVLAQSAAPDPQARINAQIALVQTWAADPVVIAAVRAHNAALSPEEEALTQEKWASLAALDPVVRGFAKNDVGQFLRSKRSAVISEAFVSDAAGRKVGFMSKTTRWSHAGQPKHEVPMSGKTWQGRIELDESTGLRQLQVAVPVLDNGQPIGSLVVGLSTAVLSQ